MSNVINIDLHRPTVIDTTPEDERVAAEVRQAAEKWHAEEESTPLDFRDWAWINVCVFAGLCCWYWVFS